MGCSSGVLSFTGPYAPQGAPLSYLLAGSPAIIANLWDVTDREIDRFGRGILDDWLQEESSAQTGCLKCCQVVKELASMHIGDGGKYKAPRNRRNAARGKEKLQEPCCSCEYGECGSKVRFASFMSRARDNCRLQFLTGASPVCYVLKPTYVVNFTMATLQISTMATSEAKVLLSHTTAAASTSS
ncbi:hypothetical protein ACLOJK_013844 [Asimina triloba]